MSVHYVPAKPGGRAPTPDILGAVLTGEERDVTETAEIMNGLVWDYAQAGANSQAVIEHTVELKRSERRASEAIIEAGKHLIAVKELLPYGKWGDWLSTEFGMSDRTARKMIEAATKFGARSEIISDLVPTVLYLLAGDSVPEEAREEVIQRAQSGERVTVATAKAVIEEHKPKPAITTRQAADILRPTIDDFYAKMSASRRYWINDMRACAQSTIGGFWFACERTLANYTYTLALLANAIRLLADELERAEPVVNTAPASVVVDVVDDVDADGDDERPVTAGMRAAQRAIWNWLVDQCGATSFKKIVDVAEALHFQEDSHPLWFRMYPQGADIDDVFWALEACIDQAAAAVPEYAQQTAALVPTANLKAAVIGWLREAYPDYYGQVAALQCMIADPMHDEDVQRMEPTLPAPYRKDDLLVAMMQASAYLDSLKDDEPEGEESREDAKALRGHEGEEEDEHPLSDPASPAARRMNELHTLKVRFRETIDLLPKFGELTGHFVDTNPAKRALQELIQVLNDEMDALAKGAKAEE